MDVRPVSGGPAGTGLTQGAGMAAPVPRAGQPAIPNAAETTAIVDAAILGLLSQPDLVRLAAVLEPVPAAQIAAQANALLQEAITAAAAGDAVRALDRVADLIRLDVGRAGSVRAANGLEPVRTQVDALLTRLANVARLDAETRVAEAARLVENGAVPVIPEWEARPEALVSVAAQLLAAGGHPNSVRAGQVAQVVIDASHWAPDPAAQVVPGEPRVPSGQPVRAGRPILPPSLGPSGASVRVKARARVAMLWRRAPLLVLLLGWLAVGLIGGTASSIQRRIWPDLLPQQWTDAGFTGWGLGFLGLVLFGFYMRVRNVRL